MGRCKTLGSSSFFLRHTSYFLVACFSHTIALSPSGWSRGHRPAGRQSQHRLGGKPGLQAPFKPGLLRTWIKTPRQYKCHLKKTRKGPLQYLAWAPGGQVLVFRQKEGEVQGLHSGIRGKVDLRYSRWTDCSNSLCPSPGTLVSCVSGEEILWATFLWRKLQKSVK